MSTLHRFKAYFGMVPLEDYEDDYVDDPAPAPSASAAHHPRSRDNGRPGYLDERYEQDYYAGSPRRAEEPGYRAPAAYRPYSSVRTPEFDSDRYGVSRAPAGGVEAGSGRRARPESSTSRGTTSAGGRTQSHTVATRGALAVDLAAQRRVEERRNERPTAEESGPLSKITTLRPRDYSEARTIGERFRDGTPVIMDLVEMSNADAKRLVDFAAGLAFALRGSFDKVATKVFLLSPADVDVSAEERRRIAETGFYSV
jgi:cell division inhibitor SepF